MEELTRYKRLIRIADLAQVQYGFRINRRKSGRKQTVLEHPETGEVVITSYNSREGQDWYFNPSDPADKGTIVDFCLARQNHDWEQVRATLSTFSGKAPDAPRPYIKRVGDEHDRSFGLLPLTDRSWLYSRGISEATLDHPWFSGRIFQQPYRDAAGQVYMNTAFPLYRAGKIAGVEVRNRTYKGHAAGSSKADACWTSNPYGLVSPIEELIIAESALDLLSYHQLFPPSGIQRLYVSTGGSLSSGQISEIQWLITMFKPREVRLGCDRDAAGLRMNLLLAGSLLPADAASTGVFTFIHQGTHVVWLELQVVHASGDRLRADAIRHLIASLDAGLVVETVLELPGETHFRCEIPSEVHLLDKVAQAVIRLRGLAGWLTPVTPHGKDFNEDLAPAG